MDLDAFLSSPLPTVIGGTLVIISIAALILFWDVRRFDREEQARKQQAQQDQERKPPQ